ncbi:MAG: hypothetical protein ACKVOK_08165 [Flavobacteriales bacterium]
MNTLRFVVVASIFLWNSLVSLASADTLELHCSKREVRQFVRDIESYKDVKCLVLSDNQSGVNWQVLFNNMAQMPELSEVILHGNYLVEWPVAITSLKKIQKLTIVGSEELFLEDGIELLRKMSSLKELVIELEYPDELPYDIRQLSQLEKITILSSDLADMRIGYERALHDSSLNRIETFLPREGTNDGIKLVFVAEKKEDSRDTKITEIDEVLTEGDVDELAVIKTETSFSDYVIAKPITKPANSFEREYTSFEQPVPNVNVDKEYYELPADKPVLVVSKCSGSQLMIPENAFVDADGIKVEGNVVVDYREFRDPVDFIFSGIPMSFNEDGDQSFFQSAGMFEVNASQNGKEVFLDESKAIEVNFVSTDSSEVYPFYAYDDGSGNWEEIGKAEFASATDLPEIPDFSMAFSYYRSQYRSDALKYNLDSTLFQERFEKPEYENAYLSLNANFYNDGYIFSKVQLYKDHRIKIRKVRRSRAGQLIFELENRTGQNKEYDKLGVDCWMADTGLKSKEFRKMYAGKKLYTDMRVEQSGDGYLLRLKGENGISEILVEPMKAIKQKRKTLYTEDEINYKAYRKELNRKQKRFDKAVMRKMRRTKKWMDESNKAVRTDETIWVDSKPYMNKTELALNFEKWKEYCDSIAFNEKNILDASKADAFNFTRSLSLSGFGIFNCDQVRRLRAPVQVLASYSDTSGNTTPVEITYVVIPRMNGVLSFISNPKKQNNSILLEGFADFALVTINESNGISLVNRSEMGIKKFEEGKEYSFAVSDAGNLSFGELRAKLGLE